MFQAQRPAIIVGNWKMHKTIAEAKSFIEELEPAARHAKAKVWLAVPFTAIQASAEIARKSPIVIGAQNMHEQESGAFTGEISCSMLKEAGAAFVILGHSERRKLFHETDASINKKIKVALHHDMSPIVCVGETLEQHQNGLTHRIIEEQLSLSLQGLNVTDLEKVILAYEPVWAIGTGRNATPEQAQDMHRFCRQFVGHHWTTAVAEKIIILYGGSVKPDNALALLTEPDIDGLLVGGSSLSVNSFSQIIDCCNINVS